MPSQKMKRFAELDRFLAGGDGRPSESDRAFAKRAGISKSVLNRLLNGQMKRYDPGLIEKVNAATDRSVGINEFRAFYGRLAVQTREAANRKRRLV